MATIMNAFLKTRNRTALQHALNSWILSLVLKSSLNWPQNASDCKIWMKKGTKGTESTSTAVHQEVSLMQTRLFAPCYLTVGSGDQLPYVESEVLTKNNHVTVVDGLKFDLYSGISVAKRGISAVIDYDTRTGENLSYVNTS